MLLVLVVAAVRVGMKNHSPKFTPYLASLAIGIFLAIGLHTVLAGYINTHSQLDYAFSAVASFALLVLIGAILFYSSLLLYYHLDEERAIKAYSSFSKANYISIPILAMAVFCIVVAVFAEIPFKKEAINRVQANVASARTISTFKSLIQKTGIEPDLVRELKNVPLSKIETSEEIVPLSFKSSTISYDQQQELEMTRLINAERAKNGVKPLEYTASLADVARNHSIDMLKRRYFAHINLDGETPFDRLHQANIGYIIAGENLAVSSSLEDAVAALMQSPTHKANILNDKFHKTGIGIATNQDGIMAISQEFTD